MDANPFKQRLAETIAWCLPRAGSGEPQAALRTEALKPVLIHDRELPPDQRPDARKNETWFQFLMGAGERSWVDVVADLSARRIEELKKTKSDFAAQPPDLAQGYLLVFEDDRSELDGQSEEATDGYFNSCDIAPWDTWIVFIPKSTAQASALLISWVSPNLKDLVESGIAANETNCLWLTPSSADLPALLAAREAHYKALDAAADAAAPPRKKRDFGEDEAED